MFTLLKTQDRHTGCPHCNYMGCQLMRENCPNIGYLAHWLWMYEYYNKKTDVKRLYRKFKAWLTRLDYSKIEDIEVDGIDTKDYPDFCDAYIASALYKGRKMTESELERLNEDSAFVYECVLEKLY